MQALTLCSESVLCPRPFASGSQRAARVRLVRAFRHPGHASVSSRSRGVVVIRAGLLDIFTGSKGAGKSQSRAADIVDALLVLTDNTYAGQNVSRQAREQIEELVEELEKYCPKNPLKSKLFWGEYEAVYASNSESVGGPLLRGIIGQLALPGQVCKSTLEPPNRLVNNVYYKALGLLPARAVQFGEITPVDGSRYQIQLYKAIPNAPLDKQLEPEGDFVRELEQQLVYLDERIRINRLTLVNGEEPTGKLENNFVIFKRDGVEVPELEEEEEAVVEEEEDKGGSGLQLPFGGFKLGGAPPSLATIAEREYARKRGGTGPAPAAPKSSSTRTATEQGRGSQKLSREEAQAAAAAAAEERKRAAAEAKARAAAEAEERKRAALAAKARAAAEAEERKRAALEAKARAAAEAEERKRAAEELAAARAAIREQLAELKEALKEAGATARQATADLQSYQRSSAQVLKAGSKALEAVTAAEVEALEAGEELAEARAAEKLAADTLRMAVRELRDVEKAVGIKSSRY